MLNLVTAPALSPVSVSECKEDLRIDHTFDDDYIQALIDSAVEYVGGKDGLLGGKVLINQTWDYSVTKPNSDGKLWLPLGPVSSITSITYYDGDEVSQSGTVSNFNLFSCEEWAYMVPKTAQTWPTIYNRPDGLTIRFVAGFGAAATDVPTNITRAIRLIVAHWYENRTAVSSSNVKELPIAVDALLNMSRKGWVA